MLRPVVFQIRAKDEIRALPGDVSLTLGSALMALQRRFNPGMSVSRPMQVVMPGVEELRLRGESGHYREFCDCRARATFSCPGAFRKKTPETPRSGIELARRRLTEIFA